MAGKKNQPAAAVVPELSEIEQSALGEICDLLSAAITKAFSEKAGSPIGMESSIVRAVTFDTFKGEIVAPLVLVHLNCSQSLEGQLFMSITGDGLSSVFDLAIPEDAKEIGAEDEVVLENLGEIINGAVSEAMAGFASSMGHTIDCSVLDTIALQDNSGLDSTAFLYPEGSMIVASNVYTMPSGAVTAGYLIPISVSRNLIDLLLNEEVAKVSEISGIDMDENSVPVGENDNVFTIPGMVDTAPTPKPVVRDMQPASFSQLGETEGHASVSSNISLLLDVLLDASIELGKTLMTIEEILTLSKGSVIELDKLASEPVEFLVNGKIIARGEVVVIDDNFGIRITEILSPRERLESI